MSVHLEVNVPNRFSGKRAGLAMKMYHGEDVDARNPKAPNSGVHCEDKAAWNSHVVDQ